MSGSVFEGNTANGYGDNLTAGAVYIENQSDQKQTLTIENSYFENNAAVGHNGYTAMGGAVHALYRSGAGADVVISDTVFTNNSATTKGGAIYVAGESLALNATKSMAYMGNTSAEGGFLYLDENAGKSASASFNISDGAILTIGAAGSGADSIAGVSSASFSKSGSGILTVNGDMSGYLGTLNVNAGTMNVNNGLGAGSINIAAGANLGVALSSGALSSSAVVNDGVLSLKRGTLSDRETVSMASYNGSGSVAADVSPVSVVVSWLLSAVLSPVSSVTGLNWDGMLGSPLRARGTMMQMAPISTQKPSRETRKILTPFPMGNTSFL